MASFNATLERYRALLAAEGTRQARLEDLNLDVGKPTTVRMYKLADKTYAKLVHELANHAFAGVTPEMRNDILNFYKPASAATASKSHEKVGGWNSSDN